MATSSNFFSPFEPGCTENWITLSTITHLNTRLPVAVKPVVAVMFTVDTVVLDTTIVSGPPALSNSAAAMFTFSSNVMGVSYECSLDGAAFSACATPLSLTDLTDGPHTLRVRATQAGGKFDPSPALHPWTVVTLAPLATVMVDPVEGEQVAFNPPVIMGTA